MINYLKIIYWIIGFIIFMFTDKTSVAQYFGRNKPNYKTFSYDVYRTPHFDIYHYSKNDSLLNNLARSSEEWYQMHQMVLKDTFDFRSVV